MHPFNSYKPYSYLYNADTLVSVVRGFDCTVKAQFRYIKIQLKTKDITIQFREIKYRIYMVYFSKSRRDVFCFKLNFNILKSGYSPLKQMKHNHIQKLT